MTKNEEQKRAEATAKRLKRTQRKQSRRKKRILDILNKDKGKYR